MNRNFFSHEGFMKTITIYGLTTILLFGLTTSAFAQNEESPRSTTDVYFEMKRSPRGQQNEKDDLKRVLRSFWNGYGTDFVGVGLLLQDENFREGLGVSPEQLQRIRGTDSGSSARIQEDPRVKTMLYESVELQRMLASGNTSEELQNRYFELQSQLSIKLREVMQEDITRIAHENLTLEQMKKVKEFQISAMSENPFLTPGMFEALALSDAQKEQLNEIQKGMEEEFEHFLDKKVDVWTEWSNKMEDARLQNRSRTSGISDPEEQRRIWREIEDNALKADPVLQRKMSEVRESDKELADTLKIKMFNVLTDEQWARMIDLIDNPPDYVRKVIAGMRERRRDTTNSSAGAWQPGPGSWQPGDDVIPEGYRLERNTRSRFPRGEGE